MHVEGENDNTDDTLHQAPAAAGEVVEQSHDDAPADDGGEKSPFRAAIEAEAAGQEPPKLPGATGPAPTKPAEGATGATAAAEPTGASGPTGATGATQAEKDAAAFRAKVDQELKDLNVKNRAAQERFRTLSEDSRKLKEVEKTLPQLQQRAAEQDRMLQVITDIGASGEQLQTAFKYIGAINSQDPARLNEAFDFMQTELLGLAKALGRDIEAVDPLAAFPDLLKEVEEGDITRARALELARGHSQQKIATAREQQQRQQNENREKLDLAAKTAIHDIQLFADRTAPLDKDFNRKLDFMQPFIDSLKANVHPSKWAAEFKTYYEKLQLPAVPSAAPTPAPTPSPTRPGGVSGMRGGVPKDARAAFRVGAAEAGARFTGG